MNTIAKVCKCCNLKLPLSEFTKHKVKKDGLRSNCKFCMKQYLAIYREINKARIAEHKKQYQKATPEKSTVKTAKRRAVKLKATPKCLIEEDFIKIEELYKEAQNMKSSTGKEYHVDHIVPLQSENVCGLHVPCNLRIILAFENLSKNNKFDESLGIDYTAIAYN